MTRSKVLETMLAFMIMLGILFWVTNNPWLLLAALLLGVIALLFKKLAEMICLLWSKLTHVIGLVVNKIVLTIVFIFILIPLSFLSKAFRKRTVDGRMGSSYFKDRNAAYTKEHLENIW
jgi:hypothetical protein